MSGMLAGLIAFAMLFSVGTGYFVFVNNVNTSYLHNLSNRSTSLQNQIMEKLEVLGGANNNLLTLTIINNGPLITNVTDAMIIDPTGALHSYGLGFSSNVSPTLPAPLNSGSSKVFSTGLTIVSGTYFIKVITQRGSVFEGTYPSPISNPSVGGNALFITTTATPPQVLSGATVTDTVVVSNYGYYTITGVTLQPSPPTATVTGTATLTGGSCTPTSVPSIAAYPGSGNPSSATFTCTYTAHTGNVGGFASFSVSAQGTASGIVLNSPEAISNTIQIGGMVNIPTQGPFSVNAFFFGYSACTNAPHHGYNGYYYPSPCTTNPATMPPSSPSALPSGAIFSGGSNYYIAFYVRVTNNFNSTLVITQDSDMYMDPDNGPNSALFLVGQASNPQTPYYPDYNSGTNGLPTLTAYTGTQTLCAESPPNYNPPPATECIEVAPGGTIILTFASCGFGISNWQWGGSQYDQGYDNSQGCSTVPSDFQAPDGTYTSIVLNYIYKGNTYTQAIPFQGMIILP